MENSYSPVLTACTKCLAEIKTAGQAQLLNDVLEFLEDKTSVQDLEDTQVANILQSLSPNTVENLVRVLVAKDLITDVDVRRILASPRLPSSVQQKT